MVKHTKKDKSTLLTNDHARSSFQKFKVVLTHTAKFHISLVMVSIISRRSVSHSSGTACYTYIKPPCLVWTLRCHNGYGSTMQVLVSKPIKPHNLDIIATDQQCSDSVLTPVPVADLSLCKKGKLSIFQLSYRPKGCDIVSEADVHMGKEFEHNYRRKWKFLFW